jgi:predicted ATPase
VTGAGGAGKTRLAVEFAAAAAGRFGDGAWLAGLAGITDPGLVPAQVMTALGVRQTSETPVIEALRYRLRSAELLLVLDNCGRLPGAAGAGDQPGAAGRARRGHLPGAAAGRAAGGI